MRLGDATGRSSGVLTNGPTWAGSGIAFDNSNDYIAIPHNPALNATTELTMVCNIRPTALPAGTYDSLIEKGTSTSINYQFYLVVTTGVLGFYSDVSGIVISTTPVVPGMWQQVAITVSPSAIKYYRLGTKVFSTTGVLLTTSPDPLVLGAFFNGSVAANVFNGAMDYVAVWSRALSEVEIQQLNAAPFCFLSSASTRRFIPAAAATNPTSPYMAIAAGMGNL